jgi:homoserine kinase
MTSSSRIHSSQELSTSVQIVLVLVPTLAGHIFLYLHQTFHDTLLQMFRIQVPATSANLGPGFDCLGLALNLYLEVTATLSPVDHFFYKGNGNVPNTANNLIHEGFRAAFAEVGKHAPTITLEVINPIPLARGLGSSSAALVAGAAIADELLGQPLGREGVFQLTAKLETHPDNVAPAIYGGFTVSAQQQDNSYICEHLEIPSKWEMLFAVPSFELLTSEARRVLPASYQRADVIYNLSRTALWSLAVSQNKPDLLRTASQDRVHEPYREKLVPGLAETRQKVLDAGAYAAFLSGAGPTVGVICSSETKKICRDLLQNFVKDGQVLELQASNGYIISV